MLALLLLSIAASPAADVARSLDEVYRAGDYQTQLPAGILVADSAAARPTGIAADLLLLDLGPLGDMLGALVWAGAVVGAVLGVVYVAQRLGLRSPADAGIPRGAEETAAALFDAPLRDANALAREGRFGEAIHVLLLRTLEQLMRAQGKEVAPGWTSREVLERATYPQEAREALSGLVSAVETCTFAGRPASEQDFLLCENRFRHLAAALQGAT